MATVKVDKSNFQADVLNASQPVVVDFWAEWCGPCKMIGPSLEEIANSFELTRERVRQIKDKAISKLRTQQKSHLLRSYLG